MRFGKRITAIRTATPPCDGEQRSVFSLFVGAPDLLELLRIAQLIEEDALLHISAEQIAHPCRCGRQQILPGTPVRFRRAAI